MSIETREKSIDGLQISVTQFPGRRGFKVQTKLLKYFTPLISAFGKAQGKEDAEDVSIIDREIDTESLMRFSESLDNDNALQFVFQLLEGTRIDGREINEAVFDEKFAGNFLTLYKILWFVVEVNFSSFFDEGGIGKILSKVKKEKSVPQKVNSLIKS